MPKVNKDFVSKEDMESFAADNNIQLSDANVRRAGVSYTIVGVDVPDDELQGPGLIDPRDAEITALRRQLDEQRRAVEVDNNGATRVQNSVTRVPAGDDDAPMTPSTASDTANENMKRDELEDMARDRGLSDSEINGASTKADLVTLINGAA